MPKYQTLEEFLNKPFGNNSDAYKTKYEQKYMKTFRSKVKITGYTKLEKDNSIMIHLSVPSESNQNLIHDVVIQFFPKDEKVASESTYLNYYMKFYSNSPGFMFNYASLYYAKGFLIDYLYFKVDPAYIRKLPIMRNPSLRMMYDSTIYMACRYLQEHRFRCMTKMGQLISVRKLNKKFFEDMKDFKGKQLDMRELAISNKISRLEKVDTSITDRLGGKHLEKEAKKPVVKKVGNTTSITHTKRVKVVKRK